MNSDKTQRIAFERYRWMFREGSQLVSATDQTGRFFDVSSALATRLGRTRHEMIGLTPLDIASATTAAQLENEWLPCLPATHRKTHRHSDRICGDQW